MRIILAALLLATAPALVPAGTAGPDCVQAHPWSEVCAGDPPVTLNCIAMSPFWELCNGNVPGVVAWVADNVLP